MITVVCSNVELSFALRDPSCMLLIQRAFSIHPAYIYKEARKFFLHATPRNALANRQILSYEFNASRS